MERLIDCEDYVKRYPDVKLIFKSRESQRYHYKRFGKKEGRIIKFNVLHITGIEDVHNKTRYRFGNLLFFTYIIDYIARINDLPIFYTQYDDIIKLGIPLYTVGKTVYENCYEVNDTTVNSIFEKNEVFKNKNIIINNKTINNFLQTPTTARYIKDLINNNKENVMKCNPYTYTNNNLFIHVRLGDIAGVLNQPYEYYDKVLSELQFDKAYISSDSIDHILCKELIKKYNLSVFKSTEVDTIQFGSSCKHIVVSAGTFSWYIGAFSFDSNVYYPEIKKQWHGDIFVFPEWKKIKY